MKRQENKEIKGEENYRKHEVERIKRFLDKLLGFLKDKIFWQSTSTHADN